MRSILVALSLGVAAATIAYAHTADSSAPVRQAGTLTCKTLADVSLMFGNHRPASCRFTVDNAAEDETYGAILPPRADADLSHSETISWRVMTAGGASRPGMLDGEFSLAEPGAVLRGKAAGLAPLGETVEAGITLGAVDTRLEIGSVISAAR